MISLSIYIYQHEMEQGIRLLRQISTDLVIYLGMVMDMRLDEIENDLINGTMDGLFMIRLKLSIGKSHHIRFSENLEQYFDQYCDYLNEQELQPVVQSFATTKYSTISELQSTINYPTNLLNQGRSRVLMLDGRAINLSINCRVSEDQHNVSMDVIITNRDYVRQLPTYVRGGYTESSVYNRLMEWATLNGLSGGIHSEHDFEIWINWCINHGRYLPTIFETMPRTQNRELRNFFLNQLGLDQDRTYVYSGRRYGGMYEQITYQLLTNPVTDYPMVTVFDPELGATPSPDK